MRDDTAGRSLPAAQDGDAIQLNELAHRVVFRLRSLDSAPSNNFAPIIANQTLPTQVGCVTSWPLRFLCLGPSDWLLILQGLPPVAFHQEIEANIREQGLVAVDISDGFATLDVRGPDSRELLCKLCGLDFHPQRFSHGQCARTRFAQIVVVVECLDRPDRFELTVARSYLQHLRDVLEDGAIEFRSGGRIQPSLPNNSC
jgi:heterotetrameric sarcosine oxidase gamma subunit